MSSNLPYHISFKGHQLNQAMRIISIGMNNLLLHTYNHPHPPFPPTSPNIRVFHSLIQHVLPLLGLSLPPFQALGLRITEEDWTVPFGTALEAALQVSTMYFAILDELRYPGRGLAHDPLEQWTPTGASEMEIMSLPVAVSRGGLRCNVCMGVIGRYERFPKLPCGHVQHTRCIHTWLRFTPACPVDGELIFE